MEYNIWYWWWWYHARRKYLTFFVLIFASLKSSHMTGYGLPHRTYHGRCRHLCKASSSSSPDCLPTHSSVAQTWSEKQAKDTVRFISVISTRGWPNSSSRLRPIPPARGNPGCGGQTEGTGWRRSPSAWTKSPHGTGKYPFHWNSSLKSRGCLTNI